MGFQLPPKCITLNALWARFKVIDSLNAANMTKYAMYSVSQKIPPEIIWHFFPNGCEFLVRIIHAYCTFLSTLDYKFLFNYLQLWRSYAILSATTICAQNVHHRPKRTLGILHIIRHYWPLIIVVFALLLHATCYRERLQCSSSVGLSPFVRRLKDYCNLLTASMLHQFYRLTVLFCSTHVYSSRRGVYEISVRRSKLIYWRPTDRRPHIWKISNGHISARGRPIHLMFGSTVRFSRSADRMALFSVWAI